MQHEFDDPICSTIKYDINSKSGVVVEVVARRLSLLSEGLGQMNIHFVF